MIELDRSIAGTRSAEALEREPLASPFSVHLHWHEYFLRFNEVHLGNPVEWGGKLLWQDGFSYSRERYEGPEWPPPEDERERHALILTYWKLRHAQLKKEGAQLLSMLEGLAREQAGRSAPLQQLVVARGEDGKPVIAPAEVSVDDWRERLLSMKRDEIEARRKLKELQGT